MCKDETFAKMSTQYPFVATKNKIKTSSEKSYVELDEQAYQHKMAPKICWSETRITIKIGNVNDE